MHTSERSQGNIIGVLFYEYSYMLLNTKLRTYCISDALTILYLVLVVIPACGRVYIVHQKD